LRPDLRIVVMSATLDGEKLARFLDAPRLSSEGRALSGDGRAFSGATRGSAGGAAAACVEQALAAHPGDVLVFLPVPARDRGVQNARSRLASCGFDAVLLPLHGELPVEAQSATCCSPIRRAAGASWCWRPTWRSRPSRCPACAW
jgi:ATP-dependent helicase HrpB